MLFLHIIQKVAKKLRKSTNRNSFHSHVFIYENKIFNVNIYKSEIDTDFRLAPL